MEMSFTVVAPAFVYDPQELLLGKQTHKLRKDECVSVAIGILRQVGSNVPENIAPTRAVRLKWYSGTPGIQNSDENGRFPAFSTSEKN